MDEIVKLVSEKLGLPEAAARQAVELVIGHLKTSLPAPIASQLDAFMSGEALKGGDNLLDKGKNFLGGLLGGNKK
ncbi:MAG: hypothetical protein IAE83_20100 [Anaerolinea sp.]|nr:hypothetical protein [Anaerolinea sp.]MCC6975836.1 hypothetical protein [Anaerolineae bacterium]CAG1012972.1 hypothetical protein ANRL4_04795 [Anaerolineae bacterium]